MIVMSFSFIILLLILNFNNYISLNVVSKKCSLKFLILPGFGNDALDYTDEFRPEIEYSGLLTNLIKRGIDTEIAPLQRLSWFNIAKGLFSVDIYRNTCKPDKLFKFYYDIINKKVRDMHEQSNGNDKIVLVCHSAGGWLARGMMSDGNWIGSNTPVEDLIAGIITLGAPHIPPPDKNEDMTRGAWTYVNENYPGCFLNNRISYVTVMGTAVRGDQSAPKQSFEGFAYDAYKKLRGEILTENDIIGDGLVPVSSGHLEGSLQINIPGVYHGVIAPNNSWYGGDHIIDLWLEPALESFT